MSEGAQDPKLAFFIVSCSGEDESFPVRELAKKASNTRGWQTPKMCDYPQELVLRFDGEVEISMVRLLSHESKIAQRLELFVCAPDDEMRQVAAFGGMPPDSAFQRLGFMGFTSNEATNFNARELKTVHLRHRAAYLKLVVKKHHGNSINPFNQVGLIGITVHGSLLQKYQAPPPANWQEREFQVSSGNAHEVAVITEEIAVSAEETDLPLAAMTPDIEPPSATSAGGGGGGGGGEEAAVEVDESISNFDPTTRKLIKDMSLHKARAVEEEDYDLAKVLKQRISDLKEIGNELADLEGKKKQAVADEEYDTAKMLKLQIEQLRARAANPQQPAPPPPMMQQQQFNSQPAFNNQPTQQQPYQQQQQQQQPPSFDDQPAMARGQLQQQQGELPPPPGTESDPQAQSSNEPSPHQGREMPPPEQPQQRPPPGGFTVASTGNDEKVATAGGAVDEESGGIVVVKKVETSNSGGARAALSGWEADFAKVIDKVSGPDAGGADVLAGAKLTEYKDFVFTFGGYCTACLFSKKWLLREAALKALVHKDGLNVLTGSDRGTHPSAVVSTLLQYLAFKGHGLQDSIGNVFFAAADALRKIVCEELSSSVPLSSVANGVATLLPDLMMRAGDNNARIREQAAAVLMMCSVASGLGVEKVAAAAFNEPDNKTKKPLHFRVQLARLSIVTTLLEKSGLNRKDMKTGLTVDLIMTRLVVPSLPHTNPEVRESAMNLVVLLHGQTPVGNLQKYLDDMKPQQRQYIQEKVEEGGIKGPAAGGSSPAQPAKKTAGSKKPQEQEMMTSSMTVDKSSGKAHPMLEAARGANAKGGAPAKNDAAKKKSTPPAGKAPSPKKDESKTCQFCNHHDSRFTEHTMDIHYVRSCPMLCPCPLCGQVIEISTLQEHLVEECPQASMVKKCPICAEAVRSEDLDFHVSAASCIPHKPKEYNVCPLCHAKLPAGDKGWEDHYLEAPGCPHNPRKLENIGAD